MVEIRDGERIAGKGGLGVALLADTEHFGAVEVHSEPAGHVPPLHLHPRHAETIFVFDGELTLRLEDRERRAGPETWVFVPPEVVHTFAVTSGDPARFLDVHVPSFGFGDFVRRLQAARSEQELTAVRAAFDLQPPPEYATGDPGLVTVCRIGGADGDTIGESGPEHRSTLVVESDELTVTEFLRRPGATGPPPHVHHGHADAFLVVGGELTFTLGTDSFSGPVGTFFLAPPDVVHTFANDGTVPAHFFNFHMPASGFGDYMRGRKPDFDQHVVPQDSGVDPATAVVTRLSR